MVRKYLAMTWRNFSPFNSTWTKWDSCSSSAYIKGKMKGCWPPFSDPSMKVVMVLKPRETFWELVCCGQMSLSDRSPLQKHVELVRLKQRLQMCRLHSGKKGNTCLRCMPTSTHGAHKTTHTRMDTCMQSLRTQINQAQLTSDCCPGQTLCLDNQQLSKQLCL